MWNLSSWVIENRFDKLKFVRQRLSQCYLTAVAILFAHESSDARILWTKSVVLTVVVDDFFDVGGSEEELLNLIQLVEKWDVNLSVDSCSEKVEVIFSALQNTIIDVWLDYLKSLLREAQWRKHKTIPTMDECMTNGCVSYALGPLALPALFFMVPKLSDDVLGHSEICHLCRLASISGRLLNDIQSIKRESKEGKLNAVSLSLSHGSGLDTEEETIYKIMRFVKNKRRELLRLVLQDKDSIVPRACKDLFWKINQTSHLFYANADGLTSNEMINVVKEVFEAPVVRRDF